MAASYNLTGFTFSMRACIVILLFPLSLAAAPSPQQIFDRTREHVAAQLRKAANYSCVLTVDRDYFSPTRKRGCMPADNDRLRLADVVAAGNDKKPFMHDRLRLDVAVSGGGEIFSWHGGKSFSSQGVGDVVKSGPISSGTFVGYLQNIFFRSGVHIGYRVPRENDGRFRFKYDVPLSASEHSIAYGGGNTKLTPFHGEFTVDAGTFEIVALSVVVDHAPKQTRICFAKSDVEYQTVPISGSDARIPAGFRLETEDDNGFLTSSQSTYQACRAFTGESTISFGGAEENQTLQRSALAESALPQGLRLSVAVRSPIDDLHSFTGDPVEGVLIRAIHVSKKNITIPRGAIVTGVITRFETHYQPVRHYVVRIRFDQLIFGNSSYALQAVPADSEETKVRLRAIYGAAPPPSVKQDLSHGVLLGTESHFRLDEKKPLDWITVPLSDDEKH